jgi:putative transcriptional regulator
MTRRKGTLSKLLITSMEEAVAISEGRLQAPRRHRVTMHGSAVQPPPRYASPRIRRLRERLALSQPVFARALNVSVATVRAWEQGLRVPDGPSRRLLEIAERYPAAILGMIEVADSSTGNTA